MKITKMGNEHIEGVLNVENSCFHIPWTKQDFIREINENKMAVYFVALDETEKVVGYAGMWHVVNEGHITNVAVLEECRGRGIGRLLLEALFDVAREREMIGITLEVKISNAPAQKLYTGLGFKPEGIRKRYYADTGEDAVIMWKYFENYET